MNARGFAVELAALSLALAVASSGCATTWAISQAAAGRPPIDENAREEAVPLPGVREQLEVVLHFSGRPIQKPAGTSSSAPTPQPRTDGPLELDCALTQHGHETVYRASTRYGKSWKKWTAVFFVLEGLSGAALLAFGDDTAGTIGSGIYLSLDALGTGILFFAPRRDVYEQKEREVVTNVRNDCPEGLLLEVDGRLAPVDALGGVGELGQALFEQHLKGSAEPLRIRVGDQVSEVYLTADDRCRWARGRQDEAAAAICAEGASSYRGRASARVVLDVPLGSLLGRATAWQHPR